MAEFEKEGRFVTVKSYNSEVGNGTGKCIAYHHFTFIKMTRRKVRYFAFSI